MFLNNPNKYPLLSFPSSIYKAAREAMDIVKTTDVIVGTSILTAMSHGVGCNTDWKHPATGQTHSSSLYLWVVAVSGDRKTTTDALICGPIYAHDGEAILKHAEKIRTFKVAHASWSSIKSGILSRIKKLARASEVTADAEEEFQAHAALEPIEPCLHRLTRQDITNRSVYEALEGDGRSIAFLVDEGQILLDSNVMRHIGVLNKIWDGASLLTYDRAKHDNIVVRNPRATISIMVQPIVLSKFLAKFGAITHGSGHWARYLIARSPSIQGYRDPAIINPELFNLVPFHNRLTELLQSYQEKAKTTPIKRDLLEFDDDAKLVWFEIASRVENDIKPGHYLNDIGDFASKYMDIVGRISAILHYFENMPSKISRDTLCRAADIAEWHLHEYKQVFSLENQRSPEQIDADAVYGYLYHRYFVHKIMTVSKNFVRQRCGVRGERYYRALDELMSWSAIGIQPGRNGAQMIAINPQFFSANPV